MHPGTTSKSGFISLLLDSSRRRLLVSCIDDVIYEYDVASLNQKPICQFVGGTTDGSYYIKMALRFDDDYLICGTSNEEGALIWNANQRRLTKDVYGSEEPLVRPSAILKSKEAEDAVCVDWCRSQWRVATSSDKRNTHTIWEVNQDICDDERIWGQAVMC